MLHANARRKRSSRMLDANAELLCETPNEARGLVLADVVFWNIAWGLQGEFALALREQAESFPKRQMCVLG